MKIYVIEKYSLDYEFVPSIYDDDEDEDIIQRIEFIDNMCAFTCKYDAEEWIRKQQPEWDGQYKISEVELK